MEVWGGATKTQYAKSGRVNLAYQVVGEGAVDLILVPGFVSHREVACEEPRLAHFLGRLASFARLIVFDKRGSGVSDHPVRDIRERQTEPAVRSRAPAPGQGADPVRVLGPSPGRPRLTSENGTMGRWCISRKSPLRWGWEGRGVPRRWGWLRC